MGGSGLEIDDDPAFQKRLWIWQRWAWGMIAGILAFAAVGGLGDGPLSRTEAGDPEGRLRIVYERFGRLEAPNGLEIEGRPDPDGFLRLRISGQTLEDFDVEIPEPIRPESTFDADGLTLEVRAAAGVERVSLQLRLRPRSPGRARIELGAGAGASLSVAQYVYP